ncbi:tetratricopeptide repeat protein, partial [Patescibacteria group bacterium]|nr:tetratricopeptide repeat protein [Patescibacteria group bacterium]
EDLENAIRDHENADKKKKECLKKAKKYIDQKQYRIAIETYEKIIRVDPKYSEAYFYMALAYYYQKKWNEAIKGFESAIKCEPEFVEAYKYLEKSYQHRAKVNSKTSKDDLNNAKNISAKIKKLTSGK